MFLAYVHHVFSGYANFDRRAFSVAGPTVWNLLPDQLKNSGCTELTFGRTLKTFFFDQY